MIDNDSENVNVRRPRRHTDDVLADIDAATTMIVFGRAPFESVGLVFVDVIDDEPPMA